MDACPVEPDGGPVPARETPHPRYEFAPVHGRQSRTKMRERLTPASRTFLREPMKAGPGSERGRARRVCRNASEYGREDRSGRIGLDHRHRGTISASTCFPTARSRQLRALEQPDKKEEVARMHAQTARMPDLAFHTINDTWEVDPGLG